MWLSVLVFVLVLAVWSPFLCIWQYQMSSVAIDVANNELLRKFLWGLLASLILNIEDIGMKIQTWMCELDS